MATTSITYTGDGSTTNYSFTFEYLEQDEVKVTLTGVPTTAFTFANATTISFTSAPASGTEIRIYRDTDIDTLKATFFPGSAIKAEDLNDNFTQNNFVVQELQNSTWDVDLQTIKSNETWVSNDSQIATTAAMDARFQDEATETIESTETWVSDDDRVPTTLASDNRVDAKIDTAIEGDILIDSTGLTKVASGGQTTLGIGASSVDLDRIKDSDIITYAEQNAGSPAPADGNIFTASAAARRFDTIVQLTTPTGSDWEVGKTWLQNDIDKTVSIWNGTAWVAVASGGSFTELSKVIYVDSVNGDDTLAGHRISNPKRTIKAAMDDINADANGDGSIVIVAPGIYGETFPIDIQKNDIGIVGSSLRNCIIHPAIPAADQAGYDVNTPEANELQTMFRVNSGTYLYGLTLQGMKASGSRGGNSLDTDSTYGLPTNQGWNFAFYPGATIKKSPYIQNCTNFSDSQINNVNFTPHTPGEGAAGDLDSGPSGGGILIDGSVPAAASPLRSMVCDSYTHTALDGPGIFVTNNGYCQATSSYSFFNHFHLKTKNGGQANLAASTTDFGSHSLIADGRSPYAIFTASTTASASDGSTTFTIGAPTARTATPLPWHGSTTRPQDNMLVDIGGNTYPILSATAAGSGWTVTISRPNPTNLTENLGLNGAVSSGAAVSFFLRSMIASSGHTMEYVGSGTDYRALPENGGVPDDTKQLTELNNGKIWAAVTDHRGKFTVGSTFSVDQQTGVVSIAGEASDTVRKSAPTGSAILPAGSTSQRDASPNAGYIRFNTTTSGFEGYDGSAWTSVGGVSDGDKGDITVSNNGSTFTIDNGAVSIGELSDGYTTGTSNVGLGSGALIARTTGNSNTAVGVASSRFLTTGSNNVSVGNNALYDTTSGADNVAIGEYALRFNTTGSKNTAVGSEALNDHTQGTNNTAIGESAGKNLTTGSNVTCVGYNARPSSATATNEITLGDTNVSSLRIPGLQSSASNGQVLTYNSSNGNITLATVSSGPPFTTAGTSNLGLGSQALNNISTGSSNVAVGSASQFTNTNGNYNVSLGANSLYYNNGGDRNVALGYYALNNNTTGDNNIAIGGNALNDNTTANNNIAIGKSALQTHQTGNSNVAIGFESQFRNNGGFSNTSVGYEALYENSNGSNDGYCTAIGAYALRYNTEDNITAIGYLAGYSNTTGFNNTFVGNSAGKDCTTASALTAVGREAGANVTTGNECTAIGSYALHTNATGAYNTAVGSGALFDCTGNNNTALGRSAGRNIRTGSSNIAIGSSALYTNEYQSNNVAIGDDTLYYTVGDNNVAIGYRAGYQNTTADNGVFIGNYAGRDNTTANDNIAIGRFAAESTTTGSNNTTVGSGALDSNTTGYQNVSMGYNANSAVTTSYYNVAIGSNAAKLVTTGITNTSLGHQAAENLTTGSNNTSLGYDAKPSSSTSSNQVTLGNVFVNSLRCNVTSISSLSDGRDKTEVEDLSLGLEFIDTLRPVKFKWDTRDGNGKDGSYEAGFIAQDLQTAQSDVNADYLGLVLDDNPDRLEASYGKLIPVLVQAIKDLKSEIETLKQNV